MTKQQKNSNPTIKRSAAENTGGSQKRGSRVEHGDSGGRALVSDLLRRMEAKLAQSEGSGSIADFIRLVQLDREMAEEEPAREIVVTWIDGEKGSGFAR